MRIFGFDFKDRDIDHVEVWYNRHEKSWVIQTNDKEGCQVGSSRYQHQKPKVSELKKEFPGLPIKFT